MLSYLYGELVRRRRRWYAAHPSARRRLARPVVSVGNLTVGGSGKTPVVACLARLLLAMGERPAILSRGYGRQVVSDGVVVVADGERLRADLPRAGDEPLMLARALTGVAVLVSPDRYLAGRLAEQRLGCTVHLLDDGFQHLALERDLDLVLVSRRDLDDARLLPGGSLREPVTAVMAADAVIATDTREPGLADLAGRFGVARVFAARRRQEPARLVGSPDRAIAVRPDLPAMAVAGIARPERFFADLRAAGWSLRRTVTFRDHHPYRAADLERLGQWARDDGIELVLTTEKDLVRLLRYRPLPLPLAWVPLTVSIEPPDEFQAWMADRVAAARPGMALATWPSTVSSPYP